MSSDDMDALRSELLRQKIIFEAELRRQREAFEERLSSICQELADREADCRNLQSVITILGRKVDALAEQRQYVTVVQRPPTPPRQPSTHDSPFRRDSSNPVVPSAENTSKPRERGRPSTAISHSGIRRPSPTLSTAPPPQRFGASVTRVASISALSRTSSPHVHGHPNRPLLRMNTSATMNSETSSNGGKCAPQRRPVSRRRTNSAGRLAGVTATDHW